MVVAAREVGTANAALEEGVASDDGLLFGYGIADAARAVSGAVKAIHMNVADREFVAVVDKDGVEVSHVFDREAHDAAIGFGLTQQLDAVGVHGDRKIVAFRGLTETADVVDMSVSEQNHDGSEPLAVDELVELGILIGGFHARVDDGALAGGLVVNDVAVDAKMVKGELFYHGLKKVEALGLLLPARASEFFIR